MKRALGLTLAVIAGLTGLWAQKTTTTTTTTAVGTTGAPTSTPAAPSPISPAPTASGTTGTTTTGSGRPVFVSGNVLTDDDSPRPGNIEIQTVCGTQTRTVAHVSAGGDFFFQWSDAAAPVFEDASDSGRAPGTSAGSGITSIMGSTGGAAPGGAGGHLIDPMSICDITAEASGYLSSRANLLDRGGQEALDIGTITLHRITGDEGRTVSILALKAPKDARKSFEKGNSLAAANKPGDAAVSFQKAVDRYPEYADAWFALGRMEVRLGAKEAARTDFEKAVDLDDKLVGPWQELGYLASDQSNWEEAARCLDTAVRLDPMSSPMAWYFSAVANYNLKRFDLAERSVRAELKLDRNPHAEYLLGLILIARKDLRGGADALRDYIGSWPGGEDVEMAKRQLSRVESQIER